MRIIAVANQKGGCAKTTTVVNLAACLAEKHKRVLVIDLDTQANASAWLGCAMEDHGGTVRLLTTKESLPSLISASNISGVDVIAASRELANFEKLTAGEISVESRLKRRLGALDKGHWDYVLIDTPPTLGLITLNALTAAQDLLVPVTTHVLSLSGVAQLIETYDEVKEILNPSLNILGFVACRVDMRTRHSKEIIELLTNQFGSKVLKSTIRESIRLAEAPSFQQSITDYESKSSASEDYRALASEIISLTL
jgi:chromosome partitioning protein